jgi:hypothetical protein
VCVFSIISCFSFTIYLILGLFILKIKSDSPLHRNFFYFCMCFAVWAFTAFYLSYNSNNVNNIFFIKLEYAAALIYEVFILRFIVYLTNSFKSSLKRQVGFASLWIVPSVFLYQNFIYNNIYNSFPHGFWYLGLHILSNFYNFISIILLIFWSRKSKSIKIKKQAGIIIVSGFFTIILYYYR